MLAEGTQIKLVQNDTNIYVLCTSNRLKNMTTNSYLDYDL